MTPRSRVRIVFLAAIALLLVSGVSTYLSFSYLSQSERWVTHTQEVRATVGDLEDAFNTAARARMGYLLSPTDQELKDYRTAVSRISAEIDFLREMTKDNFIQAKNCRDLELLTAERLKVWEE